MKSYEEMTRSVLQRAGEEKKAQRQKRIRITAVAGCACLIALAISAGGLLRGPVEAGENWQPRVSVFCVTASASQQRQAMLKGERLPYGAQIRVHDITGLESQELLQLQNADQEYAQQMAGERSEEQLGGPDWATSTWCSDKTMVTTIFAGSFYFTVDDYQQVQNVSVTTTEIGWTAQHGTNFYDASLKDGIGITWSLSQTALKMLEKDPQMSLSEFSDTVTVTVAFKDGTKEVAVIDISVDDDGVIYGTFREIYLEG